MGNVIQIPDDSNLAKDSILFIAEGLINGRSPYHVKGKNPSVGTSPVPISSSAWYQTPTTVQSLEVFCVNANDDVSGTGARKVRVTFLDGSGNVATEDISTTGSGVTPMVAQAFRVIDFRVIESGTYASQISSSHAGQITLRGAGAGTSWATILTAGGIGLGVAQLGATTIPKGYKGYVRGLHYSIISTQQVDLMFFHREAVLNVTPPYAPMLIENDFPGLTGTGSVEHFSIEELPELTDVGYLGKAKTGTASVSVEFELTLKKV